MASKNAHTAKKKSEECPKVNDNTILVNCMKPCPPCDALAKKCLTGAFKKWAEKRGFAVVYDDDNNKVTGFWKRYGKPIGVAQATPQLYIIGKGQKCDGVCLREGVDVHGYVVPSYDKWDARMLVEICVRLGVPAEE
ncbi:MAG: hypothetical protein IJS15_01995 [Victivallales bacterium]|nr:hypothetical protein [Victivallales bacterium]